MSSKQSKYKIEVSTVTMYLPEQSDPSSQRFAFAYTITIANVGLVTARLTHRHWVITDASDSVQEVHGEGVVGETPELEPGEQYVYTSGAMLTTSVGTMHGHYDFVAADGHKFTAEIPVFTLSIPRTLH